MSRVVLAPLQLSWGALSICYTNTQQLIGTLGLQSRDFSTEFVEIDLKRHLEFCGRDFHLTASQRKFNNPFFFIVTVVVVNNLFILTPISKQVNSQSIKNTSEQEFMRIDIPIFRKFQQRRLDNCGQASVLEYIQKQTGQIISNYFKHKYPKDTLITLMKQIIRLVLASIFLVSVTCTLGVDISQLFTIQDYTCMKNAGITFAIARGYCSFGGLDQHVTQSLNNIRAAGLKANIYMFPCRGKSATAQVDQMIAGIPSNLYDTVWIDVQTNPSTGCSWSGYDAASNCAFLSETANRIKAKGKEVGIYASRYMWGTIFGSYTACPALGVFPLWYAHYDNTPSFADFQSFAGWTKPSCKQYLGTTSICNASVDRNYCP